MSSFALTMEGEKNGKVDSNSEDFDDFEIVAESYFSPVSPERQVNVLRRRKASSKLTVPQSDCQQDNHELNKKDGETDSELWLEEFLNSILQDQHGEKYNSELPKDGEIDLYSSVEDFYDSILQDQHVEKDVSEFDFSHSISQQTNSKPLRIVIQKRSKVPDFSHPLACRRIRLQRKLQLQRALSCPSSLHSEPDDPEAVRSLAYEGNHCKESTSAAGLPSHSLHVNLEWMFILTNLVLEILLVVLDQIASPQKPQYTLAALGVSLVAVVVSLIELYFKAMRQGVILKRESLKFWFQYSSSIHKPFYSFIDIFGFICALCQFIFSTIAYSYHKRHADNPINISIVSLIFIICLASSKLTKHSYETPRSI